MDSAYILRLWVTRLDAITQCDFRHILSLPQGHWSLHHLTWDWFWLRLESLKSTLTITVPWKKFLIWIPTMTNSTSRFIGRYFLTVFSNSFLEWFWMMKKMSWPCAPPQWKTRVNRQRISLNLSSLDQAAITEITSIIKYFSRLCDFKITYSYKWVTKAKWMISVPPVRMFKDSVIKEVFSLFLDESNR